MQNKKQSKVEMEISTTTFETEEQSQKFYAVERDELGRIIITDLKQIPENMTEDETVKFWDTHAMSEELLDATYIEEEDEDLPPPRKESFTKPISLKMENDLLKRLQNLAFLKAIPYQTLLKQFVAERVYEEEKRERVL